MKNEGLVGKNIDGFFMVGELLDGRDRVVEADLILAVSGLSCALTVVTKEQLKNRTLETYLKDMDGLNQAGYTPEPTDPEKSPFIINEPDITEEILEQKFVGRNVWPALAECLEPQEEAE